MGQPPISLSVVIPAFNEGSRLASTLKEVAGYLRRHPWDWEIRVVDDGSSDDTCKVVEQRLREESRIVLQKEPHRGKGAAVKAGLLNARGAFRFMCDADVSMPVTELERFLPPRPAEFDVAIGTREGQGARRIGEPVLRHVAGRVFNRAVQRLIVPGINDTQCGFKMFTARAAERIFPLVTIDGWAFDLEVLYIARHQRLRIVEVPIEWHYRPESQLRLLRDGAEMFRELLRIRARAARGLYG
jgi:dolichyl-phosphate beta-glucosyltransferase